MGERTQLLVAYHSETRPFNDFSISIHYQDGYGRVMTESMVQIERNLHALLNFAPRNDESRKEYERWILTRLRGLTAGLGSINFQSFTTTVQVKELAASVLNMADSHYGLPAVKTVASYEQWFKEEPQSPAGTNTACAYHETLTYMLNNSDNDDGSMMLQMVENNEKINSTLACFNQNGGTMNWDKLVRIGEGEAYATPDWQKAMVQLMNNHQIKF